jgi:hypothetical protein
MSVLEDKRKIIATLGRLFGKNKDAAEYKALVQGKCEIVLIEHDNWNGGTDTFGIYCTIPIDLYDDIQHEVPTVEQNIKAKAALIFRTYQESYVGEVVVSPELTVNQEGKVYKISSDELLNCIQLQKSLLVSVATGGPKIQSVNKDYASRIPLIREGLAERDIKDPIPFKDLWQWYGKWSDGSLPTYQSRREFLSNLFDPLEEEVGKTKQDISTTKVFEEPTGWMRVDRCIGEIKTRIIQAKNEEQFQAIGLLGRETLISLAQAVYRKEEHPVEDGTQVSETDAKRMLDAFIAGTLKGPSNQTLRKHAKASLDLANELAHKRTADFRLAALCAEATNSVVNVIAIISGRRDPTN